MSGEPPTSRRANDGTFTPAAYRAMSRLLRVGLGVALVFLLGGAVAFGLSHPNESLLSVLSTSDVLGLLAPVAFGTALAGGNSEAYLLLGVFFLLATPLARVLAGSYYFHRGGERVLARLTFAVFVLLLIGLFVVGPLVR